MGAKADPCERDGSKGVSSEGPYKLPYGWVWARLSETGEWTGGGTPSKRVPSYWSGGSIPWISPKDMKCSKILDSEDKITELAVENSSAKLISAGALLFVVRSGILRRMLPVALLKVDATVNQDLKALTPYDQIDQEYLLYSAQTFADDILQTCSKDGTTVQNINFTALKDYLIPIAPLPEQRRIMAKIEELFTQLDAGVSALEKAQAQLKRYHQSVLKAAVEGRLTEEWRRGHPDAEPASVLLERIERERENSGKGRRKKLPSLDTSDLPELPEGWTWATTGRLCDCIVPNRDKPKSFTGNIPWITFPDLDNGIEIRSSKSGLGLSLEEVNKYKARVIPKGSVIMSCVGRFGITGVLSRDVVINQQLHAFLVPNSVKARYLAYAIKTQIPFMNEAATATTISYLNKSKCNSVPIPLPPLAEQHEIVSEIERRLSVTDQTEATLEANLKRAARLRQSILKKAFRGELVPQDPSDEPASALLERIRAERAEGRPAKNRGQVKRGRGRPRKNAAAQTELI